MDWRTWAYAKLTANAGVGALVQDADVHGSGSLEGSPARPFIMLRFGPTVRGAYAGTSQTELQVWVHDEPGDYLRIQAILQAVRAALEGVVASAGAHVARWQGESQDLADDGYGTITRWASYNLVGTTTEGT